MVDIERFLPELGIVNAMTPIFTATDVLRHV